MENVAIEEGRWNKKRQVWEGYSKEEHANRGLCEAIRESRKECARGEQC